MSSLLSRLAGMAAVTVTFLGCHQPEDNRCRPPTRAEVLLAARAATRTSPSIEDSAKLDSITIGSTIWVAASWEGPVGGVLTIFHCGTLLDAMPVGFVRSLRPSGPMVPVAGTALIETTTASGTGFTLVETSIVGSSDGALITLWSDTTELVERPVGAEGEKITKTLSFDSAGGLVLRASRAKLLYDTAARSWITADSAESPPQRLCWATSKGYVPCPKQ